MDRVEHYRDIVRQVLTDYQQLNEKSESATESALVFDETHDHYLIVLMGWNDDERIKSNMIHVRLKDGKIWIEEDWTETGVATDLLENGISKDAIVLAFHPPQVRRYTEFAAA
ncbi:XisI protein [Oscillatoria sp. CS-180]|uniref:XisI protein n=1 Tax=Oscillatoria sp. CS-180 TaxID=3021720 RepID=UPI00232E97D7|nr:XisI protein [Oscillatoria sp. CS-180]MDB9524784.1 XisI protein [Oscillatoria sp. CS-180]